MRRALASLLVASGTFLGWSAAVGAATVADAGWWDRNADALIPQVDPPPEGALRVANDPAGTAALAAVRFVLDDGEQDPTLVLRVAGDPVPEGAAFMACPVTSAWSGADGDPMSEAPEFDCEAGTALGLVAGDGAAVSFDLALLAQAPTVDVVIAPAPTGENPVTDTFTVDFEEPVDADVETSGPPPAVPTVPTGPSPDGGGGSGFSIGGGASSPSPAPIPSSSSGGFSAPSPPSVTVTVPTTEAPTATSPADGPAPTTPTVIEEVASPELVAATSSSKRWVGLVLAAAIIALGAYLWRADRARAVMTAGPVLGGLGPFVRERTGPAPDVA